MLSILEYVIFTKAVVFMKIKVSDNKTDKLNIKKHLLLTLIIKYLN